MIFSKVLITYSCVMLKKRLEYFLSLKISTCFVFTCLFIFCFRNITAAELKSWGEAFERLMSSESKYHFFPVFSVVFLVFPSRSGKLCQL